MLFVIVLLILAAAFLNTLSRKYSLSSIVYKREFSKDIAEIQEEVELTTTVENTRLFPVTFLQVTEEYPDVIEYKGKTNVQRTVDTLTHISNFTMMPHQRTKRIYKVHFNKRGRHLMKDVVLRAGDLLGFTTFSSEISLIQEVVVLPRKFDVEREFIPYGDYYGDISVKRWIIDDPVLTIGIREYTGHEPQKTIHWPSSLKSGNLMVKKFDYTTDNNVMVALNIEAHKPFWMNIDHIEIEKCISISRTILEDYEEMGIPYGFVTNSQLSGSEYDSIIPPGWGAPHLNSIVECLGRVDYGITMGFEDLLVKLISQETKYNTYVIITPSILEPYIDYINFLSNKCEKLILLSLKDKNMERLNDKVFRYFQGRD